MGLFDKLFGKRKQEIIEAVSSDFMEDENDFPDESDVIFPESEEENTQAEAENGAVENARPVYDAEEKKQFVAKFRTSFRHHFPSALDTVECHMQLPYMVGASIDISTVIEYAGAEVYSKLGEDSEKLSQLGQAAVAKVAMKLEEYLGSTQWESITTSVSRAQRESLEKTWIVLDFYCKMIKTDYIENITKLYGAVTDEIIARGIAAENTVKDESYEELLAKIARIISENPEDAEIDSLKAKLLERLLSMDSIFVIHDDSFNKAFPYVGADGKLEVQTSEKRAAALKDFVESKGDSKVVIEEYAGEEIKKFFDKAVHHGLTAIRLDNGLTPVEIDISVLYDNDEINVIEVSNRYERGMFLRELQYGHRLMNLLSDKKDSEEYRILSGAMLSARTNGYRALAGGIVYAFNIGGTRKGVTYYTPKALATAKEIMKVMGVIDENVLVAPGDEGYDVFEGELVLRCIPKRNAAPEEGFVCAFTDKENAEKVYAKFEEKGANHTIVAVTLGELCSQCMPYAGFVLDMSSYGLEVPKEKFIKISECVKGAGQIVAGKEV